MAKTTFDTDNCKGCKLCINVCPKNIILIDEKAINKKGFHPATIIEMDKCIGCAFCATICPDCVITVEK